MKKISYLFLLFLMIFPICVLAMDLPNLHSTNVILYDPEDKEILYENGADEVINIASLTKIMTTIVAIENIKNLDEHITITSEMLNEVPFDASVAGLKVGDNLTYLDLLYASMLPSGADATTALAYGICGSSKAFINLMNKKAEELGLKNTHFANVTGYDADNHYSTPKEVLELLLYSLNNNLFNKIYKTKTYTLTNDLLVESTLNLYNHNNLYDLSSIIGSKTGYTSKAGQCMSSIIKVVDKELILLTFGAKRLVYNNSYNLDDAITVINYLNKNYKNEVIFKKDDILFSIPVINASLDSYDVKVSNDIITYTDEFNKDDYKYEYVGLDSLDYKNKKGDKIGKINYYYKDKLITQDVYLDTDINISPIKYLESNINYVLPIIILICLLFLIKLFKPKKKRKHRRS